MEKNIENLVGDFTWGFGQEFFIETSEGNFIWKDPDYGGDGSIAPVNLSYKEWASNLALGFGRCKGRHLIGDYCK